MAAPHFKNYGRLKTFDFGVANPLFSNENWTNGLGAVNDPQERFEYGIPRRQ